MVNELDPTQAKFVYCKPTVFKNYADHYRKEY